MSHAHSKTLQFESRIGVDPACTPQSAISVRQDDLLRRLIGYLARHSPFYRSMFADLGVRPEDISLSGDLAQLPFTCKSNLENRHEEFLAVREEEVVDVCLTSGTTTNVCFTTIW